MFKMTSIVTRTRLCVNFDIVALVAVFSLFAMVFSDALPLEANKTSNSALAAIENASAGNINNSKTLESTFQESINATQDLSNATDRVKPSAALPANHKKLNVTGGVLNVFKEIIKDFTRKSYVESKSEKLRSVPTGNVSNKKSGNTPTDSEIESTDADIGVKIKDKAYQSTENESSNTKKKAPIKTFVPEEESTASEDIEKSSKVNHKKVYNSTNSTDNQFKPANGSSTLTSVSSERLTDSNRNFNNSTVLVSNTTNNDSVTSVKEIKLRNGSLIISKNVSTTASSILNLQQNESINTAAVTGGVFARLSTSGSKSAPVRNATSEDATKAPNDSLTSILATSSPLTLRAFASAIVNKSVIKSANEAATRSAGLIAVAETKTVSQRRPGNEAKKASHASNDNNESASHNSGAESREEDYRDDVKSDSRVPSSHKDTPNRDDDQTEESSASIVQSPDKSLSRSNRKPASSTVGAKFLTTSKASTVPPNVKQSKNTNKLSVGDEASVEDRGIMYDGDNSGSVDTDAGAQLPPPPPPPPFRKRPAPPPQPQLPKQQQQEQQQPDIESIANQRFNLKSRDASDSLSYGGSSYLAVYFVAFIVLAGLLYVVCHRKRKIIACLVEGRRSSAGVGRRSTSRNSSGSYKRLPAEEELPKAPREKPDSVQNFVF